MLYFDEWWCWLCRFSAEIPARPLPACFIDFNTSWISNMEQADIIWSSSDSRRSKQAEICLLTKLESLKFWTFNVTEELDGQWQVDWFGLAIEFLAVSVWLSRRQSLPCPWWPPSLCSCLLLNVVGFIKNNKIYNTWNIIAFVKDINFYHYI